MAPTSMAQEVESFSLRISADYFVDAM